MCPTAHSMSPSVSIVMLLFSATDGTVNIGVQDRSFLAVRMVYLLKTERDVACEAKVST